jgi:hypothetical protein
LRLSDSTYTRIVTDHGQKLSGGAYLIGTSVNTILNSRHGSFALTSTDPPFLFTGNYDVASDFTLKLNYDQYLLPDQSRVTHSDTWIKQSDSPQH